MLQEDTAIFSTDSPWLHVGLDLAAQANMDPHAFYAREGVAVCVRRLRGHKMRTFDGLMNEFGAALQFFSGFGDNWPALDEMLCHLDEWMPADAYVLVVENAVDVLSSEVAADLLTWLRVMQQAGAYWSRPLLGKSRFTRDAVPFNTVLCFSSRMDFSDHRLSSVARDGGIQLNHTQWQ